MPDSSVLAAMLKTRCPRCRQGSMFPESVLNLRKFDKMHEMCPVCNLRYERELGFYWGAMYFSYFLSVIIVVVTGVSLYYLAHDPPAHTYIGVAVSAIMLLSPFLYRYSRMLMLYLFGGVSYNPDCRKS